MSQCSDAGSHYSAASDASSHLSTAERRWIPPQQAHFVPGLSDPHDESFERAWEQAQSMSPTAILAGGQYQHQHHQHPQYQQQQQPHNQQGHPGQQPHYGASPLALSPQHHRPPPLQQAHSLSHQVYRRPHNPVVCWCPLCADVPRCCCSRLLLR